MLLPQPLEPMPCDLGVVRRVLGVSVPKVVLHRSKIRALVGEVVTARVPIEGIVVLYPVSRAYEAIEYQVVGSECRYPSGFPMVRCRSTTNISAPVRAHARGSGPVGGAVFGTYYRPVGLARRAIVAQ